jgi:predicted permease
LLLITPSYHLPNIFISDPIIIHTFISDPIIFMTLLGLLSNATFGKDVPLLDATLETLGNAYDALALFTLGMSMAVPDLPPLDGPTTKVVVCLIAVKLIVNPMVADLLVDMVGGDGTTHKQRALSLYAFLYGGLPTAPSLFIFAQQYDISAVMMPRAVIYCTAISAPLMLVAGTTFVHCMVASVNAASVAFVQC